jgi:subtilase family serine protease
LTRSKKKSSHLSARFIGLSLRWLGAASCASILLAAAGTPAYAAGNYIAQSTPAYVSTSNIVRAEDPSKTMEVSIWLNLHDRDSLDTLARDLYDPSSAQYRRWLKPADIAARFAPTAEEVKTVQGFLESQNLKVTAVGPNNFYVRARGTVAEVESAFHVQLNYYQAGTKTLRANASDPYVEGPVADLIQAVSGLDDTSFEHPSAVRPALLTSASSTKDVDLAHAVAAPDASMFETVCFPGPETEKFTTDGTFPKATYKGNEYRAGTTGCAYSPANLYDAYNLKGLYAKGFDGTGQTIVIIDWCGSPTIRDDANAFSKEFGLPKLTSSNFNITYVPGPSDCISPSLEINLDVEWAHAIAPGANIDLVVPPSSAVEDTDEAWLYAVNYGLGNAISGSYGIPEIYVSATELNKENLIAEIAAISGISSNFSSGDEGSDALTAHTLTVSTPANLPYATGVGGVSLALNADNSIAFQTGWETYGSQLLYDDEIDDPPAPEYFLGGSGGGTSAFFTKPSFQKSLTGKFRQVPDISWLGDPNTGVPVLITVADQVPGQIWTPAGGTSLACPMFSALWAIANQEAGTALGQAAPYLYSMPADTITDVAPYSSTHNVTAAIEESSTVTNSYNAAKTLGVEKSLFGDFYSAIENAPLSQGAAYVISFGEDYYLKTAVGWDDVTGLGTPNAQAFADYFAPSAGAKK